VHARESALLEKVMDSPCRSVDDLADLLGAPNNIVAVLLDRRMRHLGAAAASLSAAAAISLLLSHCCTQHVGMTLSAKQYPAACCVIRRG
jgi:hypothetical protein